MGYRGDDASHWGDPRREEPWQGPSRDEYGNYAGDPYGAPPQHGGGYDAGYGSQGGYASQGGYGSQGGYNGGYDAGYGSQGGYPQGGYGAPGAPGAPGQPAGGFPDNDWYGDSRSGGFADTSMHNRPAIPEGYHPGDYDAPPGGGFQQPPRAALPAPPATEPGPPGQVSQTRHQPVLDDGPGGAAYPGYENVEDHGGYGPGGYPAQQGYDDYDDYANYEVPSPTTSQPVYNDPAPTGADFAYNDPAPTGADFAYNEPAPTSAQPAAFDDQPGGFGGQTAVFTPGQGYDDYSDPSYADGFDGERGGQDPFPIPEEAGAAMGAAATAAGKRGKKGKKAAGGAKGKISAARSAAAARTATIARPAMARKKGNRRLMIGGSSVVLIGALAAVYFLIISPSNQASTASAPIPTPGSSQGALPCAQSLGQFCHISKATDDPQPLTVNELYQQAVLDEKDKMNFTRIVSENDKTCSKALLGSALQNAAKKGHCTQVVRASYTEGSGSSELMGTIGVVNLYSTADAEDVGKTVGTSDFIAPLPSNSGDGADLGKSTGIMQSIYKGHYLILTWAEMGDEATPTSSDKQKLQEFENDLISLTANPALSQRMVTGKPGGTTTP